MFWKCARQALTALSTAEAELQMLCEGSLATRNVGMLMKEMMKPRTEVKLARNWSKGKSSQLKMRRSQPKAKKISYW